MEILNPNQTLGFSHSEFVLLGFPGIAKTRQILVIPFLSIYVVILTGNSLIIHRIWVEKSLHSPMYFLIALLFAVNISNTTAILPKFLLELAFQWNRISLLGCLLQMFTMYFFAVFESGVILLMALDRYLAISRPLRYHDIMTNDFLGRLILVGTVRSTILVTPLVILASRVHFCESNIILNFACENMGLMNLACGDISVPQVVGMVVRVFVTVGDVIFVLVSYINILYAAMKIVVGKARHKALHTCSTHLSVVVLIYTSALSSSIVYRASQSISYDVQNLFSAVYLVIPATLNPFIYGLRVKEIRECLVKTWSNRKTLLSSSIHSRINRTFSVQLTYNKDGN
ncbi:olfactory receptor 52K1-like [Pelobates fuscus]|uniref:olfactory receptor 52K1-like n=1 Tax=Pelobates fuscus TaxID=191477 RepID=UPI002FE4EEC2